MNPIDKEPKESKKLKNLEIDIDSLNRYLSEIKKNRRNSEKMEDQLSKRKSILNKEELRAEKQQKLEEKNKEFKEIIKVNLKKDKEILQKKKKADEKNLELQKSKNTSIKQEIDSSLKNWKISVKTKNKEEADKVKEKRKLIENIKKSEIKDIENNNRKKHDLVILNQIKSEEKRKIGVKTRKMQIKKELESKIKKEMDLMHFLDEKINRQNKENEELVKRIKDFNPNFQIINLETIRKKSCYTPKMKKISFKKI